MPELLHLVFSSADDKAAWLDASPCAGQLFLQDLIELRHNYWVARREVEGPKKIDQVHADARRDDANRARAAAGGPNMRGNRGGDYRSAGLDAYGGPPQRCGLGCPFLTHPAPPPPLSMWPDL